MNSQCGYQDLHTFMILVELLHNCGLVVFMVLLTWYAACAAKFDGYCTDPQFVNRVIGLYGAANLACHICC